MHDPVGFETFRRPPFVKHQRLFHANVLGTVTPFDWFVSSSRLPVPRCSCTVWSNTVRVLSVPWGEEVPLSVSEYRFSCTSTRRKINMIRLNNIALAIRYNEFVF